MRKVQGGDLPLLESISTKGNSWAVRCAKEELEDGSFSYQEEVVNHKPTLDEIKAIVLGWYNSKISKKIIGGMVWNDIPVWLSEENQLNFSTAQAPVTLKIGEQENGEPIYQEFATTEALAEFWQACVSWRQECLAEGWEEKDAIDWSVYEVTEE